MTAKYEISLSTGSGVSKQNGANVTSLSDLTIQPRDRLSERELSELKATAKPFGKRTEKRKP